MRTKELKEIHKALFELKNISLKDSFDLSKICTKLLSDPKNQHIGRDLTIRILDAWEKLPEETYDLWNSIIEAAGLYPYLAQEDLHGSSLIRHEFHKSKHLDGIYLHEEQMKLSMLLNSSASIIVSAPTSFGKSLLIEEVVSKRTYKNIVIIQPTLALLDETRKKLKNIRITTE